MDRREAIARLRERAAELQQFGIRHLDRFGSTARRGERIPHPQTQASTEQMAAKPAPGDTARPNSTALDPKSGEQVASAGSDVWG